MKTKNKFSRVFDAAANSVLSKLPVMVLLVKTVESLANELQSMMNSTMILVKTVQLHKQLIDDLYARQITAVKSSSLDVSLPTQKTKENKPN